MKTKRSLITAFSAVCLVLTLSLTYAFKPKPELKEKVLCPYVTLTSSPSSMNVCNVTCASTSLCRNCGSSFTLTYGTCPPFTWTFTNTTTGCVKQYVTSGTSLTVNSFPGSAGDNITLDITDNGGGASPTYNMTGVQCL